MKTLKEFINESLKEAFIDKREAAMKGLIYFSHPSSKDYQPINVGDDIDFYSPKNGDKLYGEVTKYNGKSISIKEYKTGKTYKFDIKFEY